MIFVVYGLPIWDIFYISSPKFGIREIVKQYVNLSTVIITQNSVIRKKSLENGSHGPLRYAIRSPVCSLCIRKHVSKAHHCPMCKQGLTVRELRNNRVIDEVVLLTQEYEKDNRTKAADRAPHATVLPRDSEVPCSSSTNNLREKDVVSAKTTKRSEGGPSTAHGADDAVVAGPSLVPPVQFVGCPVCSKEASSSNNVPREDYSCNLLP